MRSPSIKKLVDALDAFNSALDDNKPFAVDDLLKVLIGIDPSALFFNDPYAGTARERTVHEGRGNEILVAQGKILDALQKMEDFSKNAEQIINKLSDGSDISEQEAEYAQELFMVVGNEFKRVEALLFNGLLYAKPPIKDIVRYDGMLRTLVADPKSFEPVDVEFGEMSSVKMSESIKILVNAFEFEKAMALIELYQQEQKKTNSEVVNNILNINNDSIKELIGLKRGEIPQDDLFDDRFAAANKLYDMYNMASYQEFEAKEGKRLAFLDKVKVHAILDKDAAKSLEELEYKRLDEKASCFKGETALRGDLSLGSEVEGFSSRHSNHNLGASSERLDAAKFWDEHLKQSEQNERKEPKKDAKAGKSSLKVSK